MQHTLELNFDVKNHIDLLQERGRDVAALRARYQRLLTEVPAEFRSETPEWRSLEQDVLSADEEWETGEPNELAAIRASRTPQRVDDYATSLSDTVLADRVAGGWYGRIAGCILGKPVECLMREGNASRARLKELLLKAGDWPLREYVSERAALPYYRQMPKLSWFPAGDPSLREHIRHAPVDDDLNYTVLSLRLVQQRGCAFTPDDVLECWMGNLPFNAVCTAEKIAYQNHVMGMRYPRTARFLNTYREWIGAQIRTDLYGYLCPGQPERAAAMAWNDAAATHTENGIYGAMWVAASIAAAFVESDPELVVRRGLEQIPTRSRFHHHVTETLRAAKGNGDDFEATFDDISRRLGSYHCVHAINNACIVVAGLLHGTGDFSRSICIAVMGGLDTDCNGATAGSIAGVMKGKCGIPGKWLDPLNDTLHSSVRGSSVVRISDLVSQTLAAGAAGLASKSEGDLT